jgi:hypothetical protein
VEAIASHVTPGWADADKVIAGLTRWYHECDGGAARQAIWDLNRAVDRNKKDLALSALLGTALMHGPEVQIEGATGVTNRAMFHLSNSERDGARLLAKAAADPRFPTAALEVANVALATRHEATVKVARAALHSVTARTASAEHLRLAAELALVAKDYAAAQAEGERAVALGDTGAFHAAGIARIFTAPDSVAARVYLAGLADPRALDLYYDDLSYLLLAEDTLAWQALPSSERPDWIRKQWEWRAATSSLSLAERLKLHFTRLTQAWDMYPRTVFRSGAATNAVVFDARQRRMSLDDRGLIYVRHGAPNEVIRMSSTSLDNTRMAWGYSGLADGRALFEFTKMDCPQPMAPLSAGGGGAKPTFVPSAGARGQRAVSAQPSNPQGTQKCVNSGDYYLATPLGCQDGPPNVIQATFLDYGTAVAKYDPAFSVNMLNCYTASATGNADNIAYQQLRDAQYRGQSIERGNSALRTESAGPPLTSPLSTILRTYAMRAGDETKLFAFAATEGSAMHPREGSSEYALRLLLSVENTARLVANNVDTIVRFRTAAPMTMGQMARTSINTSAAPAPDVTVRFSVRNENDPAQGQIITTTRAIPDFSGNRFALSDLVIAEPRAGSWVRGSERLAPTPGHYVDRGAIFRLYHELYGAQAGDSLTTRITIAPGTSDNVLSQIKALITRKSAMQVGFADRAEVDASGVVRMSRDIGADLEPGRYIVSVTVTNERTKLSAESRTELVVLKP